MFGALGVLVSILGVMFGVPGVFFGVLGVLSGSLGVLFGIPGVLVGVIYFQIFGWQRICCYMQKDAPSRNMPHSKDHRSLYFKFVAGLSAY